MEDIRTNYRNRIGKIKEELEQLKNKYGNLTLEETKKLLLIINSIYKELNIRYNVWNVLPLEDMNSENSDKIDLAEIPRKLVTKEVAINPNLFGVGYGYGDYYEKDLQLLWKEYQGKSKNLGIDVKKYSEYYNESEPKFEICVSLDDISDLPIDYEKVKILTKEELKEIIEREEKESKER